MLDPRLSTAALVAVLVALPPASAVHDGSPWTWSHDLTHFGNDAPAEPNARSGYAIGSTVLSGGLTGLAAGTRDFLAVQRLNLYGTAIAPNLAAAPGDNPGAVADPGCSGPTAVEGLTYPCALEVVLPGGARLLPVDASGAPSGNGATVTPVTTPWTERLPTDLATDPVIAPGMPSFSGGVRITDAGEAVSVPFPTALRLGVAPNGLTRSASAPLPWGCWKEGPDAAAPLDASKAVRIPGSPATTAAGTTDPLVVSRLCGMRIQDPTVGGPAHRDAANAIYLPRQAPLAAIDIGTGSENLARVKGVLPGGTPDPNAATSEGLYFDAVLVGAPTLGIGGVFQYSQILAAAAPDPARPSPFEPASACVRDFLVPPVGVPKTTSVGCPSLFQGAPAERQAAQCTSVEAPTTSPNLCPYHAPPGKAEARLFQPNGNLDRAELPAINQDGAPWTLVIWWGYARDLPDDYLGPTGAAAFPAHFRNDRIEDIDEDWTDSNQKFLHDTGKFYKWTGFRHETGLHDKDPADQLSVLFDPSQDTRDEFRPLIDWGAPVSWEPADFTSRSDPLTIDDSARYAYLGHIHVFHPQYSRGTTTTVALVGGDMMETILAETLGSVGADADPDRDFAPAPGGGPANGHHRTPLDDDSCDLLHDEFTCAPSPSPDHPEASYTGASCRIDTPVSEPGWTQGCPHPGAAGPALVATPFGNVGDPLSPRVRIGADADDDGDGCVDATDEAGVGVGAPFCDRDGPWHSQSKDSDLDPRSVVIPRPWSDTWFLEPIYYSRVYEFYTTPLGVLIDEEPGRQLDWVTFVDTLKNDAVDMTCTGGDASAGACTQWLFRTRSELASLFADNYIDIDTYVAGGPPAP